MNNSTLSYSICNHEWSFLEGEKKHSHTLKAGRHLFPFQLQIGGSLPSSVTASVLGGAFVTYKLRAVTVRPGLAHNWQTVAPITICRSFSPEALEYQQTLEIENTWPEKLMYSVMIPHKAWAIGDTLTALAKFSPLAKGVRVLNVTTSILETTKLYVRHGYQEHTRMVVSAKHEIVGHKAVCLEEHFHRARMPLHSIHVPSPSASSPPSTPGLSNSQRISSSGSVSSYFTSHHTTTFSGSNSSTPNMPEAGPSSAAIESDFDPNLPEDQELNVDDVVTQLTINIPLLTTATHALEPIVVSHRIRWYILIGNRDGHNSELRCSLPLHLLEHRFLEESRVHTATTRRLLLGGPEVPEETQDGMELPSYRAHVYDRVANMFLPDAATIRVTNPWVHQGSNPPVTSRNATGNVASGTSSPLDPHPISSHLPHAPGSGPSTPLEWVNSELLLSLSQDEPASLVQGERHSPSNSNGDSLPTSRPASGPGSNQPSRRQSRASSPDHYYRSPHTCSSPGEIFVHNGSQASRNVHGLFQASIKPLSWLSSRSSSHSNLPSLLSSTLEQPQTHNRPAPATMPSSPSGSALLHRAFTEVPDYGFAARGFIGGVTPLTSMRDLPSYDEAERSHSDPHITT